MVIVALVMALFPSVASAHTEFAGSEPTDGARVGAPVDRVVLSFTNPATPSGEGLVLLDGSGIELPTETVVDGSDLVLVPARPLAAGAYGVRWEVRAGDAHPIDGTVSFTVTTGAGADGEPATPPSDSSGLAEALESAGPGWADPIRATSRVLVTLGAMLAIGGLVALVRVVRGADAEIGAVLGWVRLGGLAVTAGGITRLAVLATTMPTVAAAWANPLGASSLLRVAGGLAIATGLSRADARRPRHSRSETDSGSPAPEGCLRWTAGRRSAAGLLGVVAVIAAFWLDGHTASRGPWLLHAAVNTVHVLAAAIWSGGVLVLAGLVWWRHRRAAGQDGAWLVGRFAEIAGISLAAVVTAGAALAVVVLDEPSELWTTPWGRLLIAKSAVVAVAAGLGGMVHTRLRPALHADSGDLRLPARVRASLSLEAVTFVAVIALTAWLVGATTS